jgi:hypothetical protein
VSVWQRARIEAVNKDTRGAMQASRADLGREEWVREQSPALSDFGSALRDMGAQ